MVIKGGARGGPVELAAHLERTDENERVTIIGIHGLAARDIEGALIEMDALGTGLKTSRTLYHTSINVGYDDRMSDERWQIAGTALREKLDLEGQPYIEIEHEKKGRTHRHLVISRIDVENERAISDSHNYRKHEEVARDLERQFGHERVQGAHVERDGQERPERTPSYAEMQQAKRTGLTPQEAKEFITGLWQATDSGKAFNAALEAEGWMLARGDKRDFVLIDPEGETHSLARRVEGAKAKDVRARMADLDPAMLPSVEAAREMQHARHPQREAERAPEPVVPMQQPEPVSEVDRPAARGRYAALDPVETARTATAQPEMQKETRGPFGLPETVQAPEQAPVLTESELRSVGSILGGFLDGIAKPFGKLVEALADMFAPPPPPTKDQVERNAQASEAAARETELREFMAEQDRRTDAVNEQSNQERQQKALDPDFYTRFPGLIRDADSRSRDDDEYDRGRERER